MHTSTYDYLKPTDDQIDKMGTFVIRAHRSNAMWVNVSITRLPDGTPRE